MNMENNILDTIATVQQSLNSIGRTSINFYGLLDMIYKMAMVCIAFFNLGFALYNTPLSFKRQ